jgi:hypothetical protein
MYKIVDEHVPTRSRRTLNKPVRMSCEVIRAIRHKRRLWKRVSCGTVGEKRWQHTERLRRMRQEKFGMTRAETGRERHNKRKTFFSYLKGKTQNRETVGLLKDGDQ